MCEYVFADYYYCLAEDVVAVTQHLIEIHTRLCVCVLKFSRIFISSMINDNNDNKCHCICAQETSAKRYLFRSQIADMHERTHANTPCVSMCNIPPANCLISEIIDDSAWLNRITIQRQANKKSQFGIESGASPCLSIYLFVCCYVFPRIDESI